MQKKTLGFRVHKTFSRAILLLPSSFDDKNRNRTIPHTAQKERHVDQTICRFAKHILIAIIIYIYFLVFALGGIIRYEEGDPETGHAEIQWALSV